MAGSDSLSDMGVEGRHLLMLKGPHEVYETEVNERLGAV